MKKVTVVALMMVLIITILSGCSEPQELILATTTSTENSGLLDDLIPLFEEEFEATVKVVAVGTGAALQMGRDGEADALLVHAKPDELLFVEEGYGLSRNDVMYNDFIIVGPSSYQETFSALSLTEVFEKIEKDQIPFVSRGDNSGTHKKEMRLWSLVGTTPAGEYYLESGQGMGDSLMLASEKEALIMTDRATYLSMADELDLVILFEGEEALFNQYGVIVINPDLHENIHHELAQAFSSWLQREDIQELIGNFGKEAFGMSLFFPNAK